MKCALLMESYWQICKNDPINKENNAHGLGVFLTFQNIVDINKFVWAICGIIHL